MAEQPSQIEWYLARDGKQHGPLSEHEMRAFVDLGHLRVSDLIWRAGFPEWRSAPEVFAIHTKQPSPPPHVGPAPQSAAAPTPSEPARASTQPTPADAVAPATASATLRAPANVTDTAAAQSPLLSPDQLVVPASAVPAAAAETAAPADRQIASFQLAAQDKPAPASPSAPAPRPQMQRGPTQQPARTPNKQSRDQRAAAVDSEFEAASLEADRPPRRRSFGRIAATLLLAAMIGGGVTFVMKRDELTSLLPLALSKLGISSDTAVAVRAAPFATAGGTIEDIDENFQRTPIWRHIKQEFPEWYAERVQEAARFAAEKRGDSAIARHLAEAVVSLRRKHAEQALTASPERLRFVATAFLDNLQSLAKHNVDTCYGFISQGETYPQVLEMMQKPAGSEALQKQVMAVFEAISEGRKAPKSYLPPRKSDYDALATELNARGWSDSDLRTFSDPRALGRASPQQVCRMVQDWFAAQIAIKDPDSQLRLLVESLRPVVAG